MNVADETTLKASLIAFSQLNSLPENVQQSVQQSVHQIGLEMESDPARAIAHLRKVISTHTQLSHLYEQARLDLKQQYQAQERTKSASIPMNGSIPLPLNEVMQTFTADNIIDASQRLVKRLSTQASSGSKEVDFWERGDRILALTAGGAALGGTIGQIPGAIVGGVLAAAFAWFTKPASASKGTSR